MKRETIPFELRRTPSMIGLSVRAIGTHDVVRPAPALQRQEVASGAGTAREKLWRLDSVFHCSIIGTCLSTGELRKLMQRITGNSLAGASDHEVHHDAVAYCSSPEQARILHRALDERHAACIHRFAHVRSEAELVELWETVKQEGDVPGGYWTALTHGAATLKTRQRVFGDVHMLSHLVGAANRADIRRLARLETENADLVERLERQQERLQQVIAARDEAMDRLSR